MKKSFLFYLCIIPLVTSCNRSISLGFENPFPDDSYLKEDSKEHYIGFRFLASDERVEKSFTVETDIINTIKETINGSENYNRYITNSTASIYTRVYDRAFANQFKQGYTALNSMSDEKREIQSQDYGGEPLSYTKRRVTSAKNVLVNDYTYGQVKSETESISYDYIVNDITSLPLEESKEDWTSVTHNKGVYIHTRSQTSVNGSLLPTTDTELATYEKDKSPEDSLDVESMQISQSDYIFVPDQSAGDPSGISEDGTPILIKRSTVPYGDDGFYHLGDGRQFSAVTNTITVSQLQLMKVDETHEWENDWYLVKKVRQYSEVTITSEEVEPNMPISTLAVPVTIQFQESRISFAVNEITDPSTEVLPEYEVTEL